MDSFTAAVFLHSASSKFVQSLIWQKPNERKYIYIVYVKKFRAALSFKKETVGTECKYIHSSSRIHWPKCSFVLSGLETRRANTLWAKVRNALFTFPSEQPVRLSSPLDVSLFKVPIPWVTSPPLLFHSFFPSIVLFWNSCTWQVPSELVVQSMASPHSGVIPTGTFLSNKWEGQGSQYLLVSKLNICTHYIVKINEWINNGV